MELTAYTWWLRADAVSAKRITPAGLLVGRSAHCDIVLRSEEASRRHALVYLGTRGPRLVALGRVAPQLNGKAIDDLAELSEGDKVQFLDLELEVARDRDAVHGPQMGHAAWVLEGPAKNLFGMSQSPFLVGGSPEDDLYVEGWPPAALCFRIREDGALEVEPRVDVVQDDTTTIDAQAVKRMKPGDVLSLDGASVKVVTGGDLFSGTTAHIESRASGVTAARLEFLPRGGRLHVTVGGEAHSVYLTDRRCDLIAILLQPPEPYTAGEFIDDDVVLSRVWGVKKRVDRTNLNVLIHRIRKDLGRVGLDGTRVLERSEGGGATRFVLEPNAEVELR